MQDVEPRKIEARVVSREMVLDEAPIVQSAENEEPPTLTAEELKTAPDLF
jgi:hypothetical protein